VKVADFMSIKIEIAQFVGWKWKSRTNSKLDWLWRDIVCAVICSIGKVSMAISLKLRKRNV